MWGLGDGSMSDHVENFLVARKQSLHANVIRACWNCGAPGFWHNTPGVNVGCYAPEKVTRLGEDFVGTTCPNCGALRDDIEHKGEIWRREFRINPWRAVRAWLRSWWKDVLATAKEQAK